MEFIQDKAVYAAMKFASKMIVEGKEPWLAIHIAAGYYDVDESEVAHYVSLNANEKKKKKK